MAYFRDVNYMYDNDHYVRYCISGGKPDDVELHYMLSPDFNKGPYVPEISSYKDLQEFSKKETSCIGREKPVYHLREVVPSIIVAAYDPHPGKTYSEWCYPCSWFPHLEHTPTSGYYVFALPDGYEDVVFYTNSDSKGPHSWYQIRGEVYKPVVENGRFVYAWASIQFTNGNRGIPTSVFNYEDTSFGSAQALFDECYAYTQSLLASCDTAADVRALPDYSRGSIGIYSSSDLSRYFYSGNWVNEHSLFDPKLDYELVSKGHSAPVGLDARLAAKAIADTSFNSNSIANLLDLFDLAVNLKNGDFGKILLDFKQGGKVAADAWLKYRYVYSTTKADYEELTRYASNGEPTVCRAGEQTSAGRMQMKIKLAPKTNQIGKMVDRLTGAGLAPNLYNLWDLVPFSFVADWFVGIGDFLEGITQYGRCAAYDIMSVTTSWKWDDVVEKGHTKAKYTFYERKVSPSAPAYVPYVESRSASGETILKRCADTVALISG